jgi:glutamate--cysteine ligase
MRGALGGGLCGDQPGDGNSRQGTTGPTRRGRHAYGKTARGLGVLADPAENSNALYGGLKGVEKESLRVGPDGSLSPIAHPATLGSALTNRFITTDFSEALLEFVTPAFVTTWEALQFICDIHQFTYAQLGEEMLWSASMPCVIPDAQKIPLARYGRSNVGRMKTIYRRALGYRYG